MGMPKQTTSPSQTSDLSNFPPHTHICVCIYMCVQLNFHPQQYSSFKDLYTGRERKRDSIISYMNKISCDKEDMKKGAWSKQEDQKLTDYINKHGEGRWRSLPEAAGLLRCGKSCRLRWINYLKPEIKRGNFAEDEEDLIIKLHALLGNRWSLIAGRLPGRTDDEVKNYWNSHLRRKLVRMGIDPKNHRRLSLPQNQALPDTSTTTSTCSNNTSPSTTTPAAFFSPVIMKSSAGIVSDAGSCTCIEEEEDDQYYSSSDLLPDLNLYPPLPSI